MSHPKVPLQYNLNTNDITKKRKVGEEDDDEAYSVKKPKTEPKIRRTSAAKKEKPVKERAAVKSRKRRDSDNEMSMSTPVPGSSVDRRRSSRGASAKKSYVDRDDSEDDEEMWDGVAEWEYTKNKKNRKVKSSIEDAESDAEVEEAEEAKDDNEDSPGLEPEEIEDEEAESTLPPARKRGRLMKAATRAVESKPLPAAKVAKQKLKPKSATLVVGKGKGRQTTLVLEKIASTKGKGKAKEKVKDVFDMDDDSE